MWTSYYDYINSLSNLKPRGVLFTPFIMLAHDPRYDLWILYVLTLFSSRPIFLDSYILVTDWSVNGVPLLENVVGLILVVFAYPIWPSLHLHMYKRKKCKFKHKWDVCTSELWQYFPSTVEAFFGYCSMATSLKIFSVNELHG